MALPGLPDFGRIRTATPKVVRASGGDGTITVTGLANGSAWQSTKVFFGNTRAAVYGIEVAVTINSTPTDSNRIELFANQSSSSVAGTDNKGGCSGADAAYTGYASNLLPSLRHLTPIGAHVCTVNASPTVQAADQVGSFSPTQPYASFVVLNNSGAALADIVITFVPQEDIAEDT